MARPFTSSSEEQKTQEHLQTRPRYEEVEEICKQSMELGAEEPPFFVTAIKCVGMECLKWFRIFRYI